MGQRPHRQYHHWSGVYAVDFTLDAVRRRAASLAAQLSASGWSCLVAADTRFMASQFALDAFRTLESSGALCLYCPTPAPLPAIERALDARRADCALMISAGSEAAWQNGMIAITPGLDAPLFGDLPEPDRARPFPPVGEPSEALQIDLRALYLEALKTTADIDLIRRTSQTIFVDSMGGTLGGYVTTLLGDGSQTRAIEINRDPDPLFARRTPHPSEAGLVRLRKLVRESDSHLGVAISADGRAIGVVDNLGDLISPVELALALAKHLARHQRYKGTVVIPAGGEPIPGGARAWEDTFGLKIEQSEGAAHRISEIVERDRNSLLVGVTPSGEVTLGRSAGAPDGMAAALVLIEAIARAGLKLRPLIQALREI
jgi:phosphomannomutase